MKIKVEVSTDSRLVKQAVVISEQDNPRNYICVTTHRPRESIQAIINQLQEYLNEN